MSPPWGYFTSLNLLQTQRLTQSKAGAGADLTCTCKQGLLVSAQSSGPTSPQVFVAPQERQFRSCHFEFGEQHSPTSGPGP